MINKNWMFEKISSLTDKELEQCFKEFEEYNEKGYLEDYALIRQIRNEYSELTGFKAYDQNCMFTAYEILYEIAKRHYKLIN